MLLSFSRAAWGQFAYTALADAALTFVTTARRTQRLRIVLLASPAWSCWRLFIAALLSIDSVADLFKERASLEQSYDVGAPRPLRPLCARRQLALDQPFGIGPLQFNKYLPRGPAQHLSQRLHVRRLARRRLSIRRWSLLTLVFGFRAVFVRTPWQQTYHRGLCRLRRRRGRKRHHRQRPLAPLLPAARRDLGADGGVARATARAPALAAHDRRLSDGRGPALARPGARRTRSPRRSVAQPG